MAGPACRVGWFVWTAVPSVCPSICSYIYTPDPHRFFPPPLYRLFNDEIYSTVDYSFMFVIVSCELDKLCCCASSCCCSIYIPKCNLSRLGCYKCNERCGCLPQRRIIGYYIPRTPLKVESYHMRWIRFQGLESVLPHQKTRVAVGPSGGQYRVDFFGVSDSDPSTV